MDHVVNIENRALLAYMDIPLTSLLFMRNDYMNN